MRAAFHAGAKRATAGYSHDQRGNHDKGSQGLWWSRRTRRIHAPSPTSAANTSIIVANIWLIRYAPQRALFARPPVGCATRSDVFAKVQDARVSLPGQTHDLERRCLLICTYAEHKRTPHIWQIGDGLHREGVAIEVR